MSLFHSIVRGYRRLAAHLVAPKSCPICLDELPMIGLMEAKPRVRADTKHEEEEEEATFAKLTCKHRFCTGCIKQYINMKIQGKEVDEDQLVCPVLSCKKWIAAVDIKRITGDALLQQFQVTLKRKRVRRGHAEALLCFNVTVMVHRRSYVAQDERNPSARWCPRPGCEELIICESMADFTCPKCKTVGCFQCRGFAHRFWFCQVKEDESYLEWERSVGNRQAVRPCPQCHMRIWKAEGHYACYELPIFTGPLSFLQRLQRVFLYAMMLLIVVTISVFGIHFFLTGYMLIWGLMTIVQRIQNVPPPA